MKKVILACMVTLGLTAVSCNNESIAFDDFERQTIYMPYQYPVRTLSLGKDRIDNSLDREHKFHMGVCVGGYYNYNKQDWRVDFTIDPSLVPDYFYRNNVKVETLPEEYYTLTPSSQVVIPEGSFNGLIQVQLTDAFFEDPKALTGAYVIPVRITGSPDTENILWGKPASGREESADIHISEDWIQKPMYFALFGVKYVNPWHGSWLRRGALIVRDQSGAVIPEECVTYRKEFVEQDEVVKLTTTAMTSLKTELSVKAERWMLALNIDKKTNRMTVESAPDSPISISGTGSYKEDGDKWGGTPEKPILRDAIYLNYYYERENGQRCEVSDTLVFRDRGIVFEADRPSIKY